MSPRRGADAAPTRAAGRVRFETLWLLIPAATLLAIALLGVGATPAPVGEPRPPIVVSS